MDKAHERSDGFLAAQGYAPEAFEFVEEAFDLMTLLVERPVNGRGDGAGGVGLDLSGCAKIIGNECSQQIGVVSSIGDDVTDAHQT